MIKVIKDYYITVETNPINYTVRRGAGKKDAKGSCLDKPLGHLGDLRSALFFIRKQIIAEELSEGTLTLRDAIRRVEELNREFDLIIRGVHGATS